MHISNWKPVAKGALKGFFTLHLGNGVVIHDCTLFEKEEIRWVGLPSKKFEKRDGTEGWSPIVAIEDSKREAFQAAVLKLVEPMLNSPEPSKKPSGDYYELFQGEEIPF